MSSCENLGAGKEEAPWEGISLGAQVWGVIKRKPRLGARGFQFSCVLGSDLEGS